MQDLWVALDSIIQALPGAAAQGVLWGIMTLGVYLTYRVLDYADLTVDGSFATGGAVSAVLIISGMNPLLTLVFATLAGMLCGMVTGLLHTWFKIPPILSGILSMIALYSINIRIMDKANLPLLGETTIISVMRERFGLSINSACLIVGILLAAAIVALLYWFFGTELGSAIRATGNNEAMARSLGVSTSLMKILGLTLSNGLVALSGALVAQQHGYAEVGMGSGAIMIGLASVIIGEVIFGARFSFAYKLGSVVIGSVIYRVIIAVVLYFGMRSTDLKLFTAIVVALALALPVFRGWLREKLPRRRKEGKTC